MPEYASASLIITGGYYTGHTVARYDWLGYVGDLPSLLIGRWNHGCGTYTGNTGTQVLTVYSLLLIFGLEGVPGCWRTEQ